jgi:hypothetical protein
MISWLDIVSPTLRSYFDKWQEIRRNGLMPEMREFETFARAVPSAYAAAILVPPNESAMTFMSVADGVSWILPGCKHGMKINDIQPPSLRITVSVPVFRVVRSHQPDCIRSHGLTNIGTQPYEALILPFGNRSHSVRVVQTIYDSPKHHERASA